MIIHYIMNNQACYIEFMPKMGKNPAPPETLVIEDLEQVRVLADPLRVRILELLCTDARTTKQVAKELGEKTTKLYHHVDALEKVGLIELVRTEPKRGTLEKYYRGVARRFEVASSLFRGESAAGLTPFAEMVDSMAARQRSELQALLATEGGAEELESKGMFVFAEVHATDEDIGELRSRLEKTLEELAAEQKKDVPDDARRYRLIVGLYPVDR